jgi:hypothetical protein
MDRAELITHIKTCDVCGDAEIRASLDQEATDDLGEWFALNHPDLTDDE